MKNLRISNYYKMLQKEWVQSIELLDSFTFTGFLPIINYSKILRIKIVYVKDFLIPTKVRPKWVELQYEIIDQKTVLIFRNDFKFTTHFMNSACLQISLQHPLEKAFFNTYVSFVIERCTYSHVPIKQVDTNKQEGWILYEKFINKQAQKMDRVDFF